MALTKCNESDAEIIKGGIMSRLTRSIVVTIALVAGATAHARTSTYEFVGDFYNQDFNWHVSSARFEIKVSSTDYGSPVKLERLEIYPFDPNPEANVEGFFP